MGIGQRDHLAEGDPGLAGRIGERSLASPIAFESSANPPFPESEGHDFLLLRRIGRHLARQLFGNCDRGGRTWHLGDPSNGGYTSTA